MTSKSTDQAPKFQYRGVTDEVTTCECCGKPNLKQTVILTDATGRDWYYGTTCAAKALRKTGEKIDASVIRMDAKAMALAQRWLAAGYDRETIGKTLWNRFGYCYQVKDGVLIIRMGQRFEL